MSLPSLAKTIKHISSNLVGQVSSDLSKLIEKNEAILLCAEMFGVDPRLVAARVYVEWLKETAKDQTSALTQEKEAA